tara:strand:- start:259 stop:642 length:384 start_codon:yes stop_codon:yes gene_type:complete
MSGPFKMKGFSYPGEAPAKESPAKIFGGLKKFGSKLLKGHDGKFDWQDVGRMMIPGASLINAMRSPKADTTISSDAYRQSQKDPNAEQEIKTEVANLPDNEKDEILTKVVQEKKEAEASGDTGDATL